MRPSELIQLLEAMTVDDFLQLSVGIVSDAAVVVENHQFAILGGIGFPFRKPFYVGVARVRKLCPCAAHQVSQTEVVSRGVGQVAVVVVQTVEAEFQFGTMHGTLVLG